MTPNERALLDELLKLQKSYETGSQDLREMFERTSSENDQISQHLNALSNQVEALSTALASLRKSR